MTPVYLNPPCSSFPVVELKEEQQLQLFLSPQQAASSLSGASQDHHRFLSEPDESKLHDHKANEFMSHFGGSSDQQACSSSSVHPKLDSDSVDDPKYISSFKREEGYESAGDNGSSSAKWIPSKMRLMQRMVNSNSRGSDDSKPLKGTTKFHQYQTHESNEVTSFNKSSSTIRVCADCNTTSTPLWRSGPRGPKSLCNACGIRQRKARRAMEAAANGAVAAASEAPSIKMKVHGNKEKKWRSGHHVGQHKKQCKPLDHPPQGQKKLCFKDFALSLSKNSALQHVFTQDVEDAAILLMELSCGLIHT